MKKITAYVRTCMAEKVLDALLERGIRGVSVFQGKGFVPHSKGPAQSSFDTAPEDGLVAVAKLEIVSSDSAAGAIIRVIQEHAHTGRPGDGKIFVLDVVAAHDIRTSEVFAKPSEASFLAKEGKGSPSAC